MNPATRAHPMASKVRRSCEHDLSGLNTRSNLYMEHTKAEDLLDALNTLEGTFQAPVTLIELFPGPFGNHSQKRRTASRPWWRWRHSQQAPKETHTGKNRWCVDVEGTVEELNEKEINIRVFGMLLQAAVRVGEIEPLAQGPRSAAIEEQPAGLSNRGVTPVWRSTMSVSSLIPGDYKARVVFSSHIIMHFTSAR
jgi:hypothetical protein